MPSASIGAKKCATHTGGRLDGSPLSILKSQRPRKILVKQPRTIMTTDSREACCFDHKGEILAFDSYVTNHAQEMIQLIENFTLVEHLDKWLRSRAKD